MARKFLFLFRVIIMKRQFYYMGQKGGGVGRTVVSVNKHGKNS